MVDDGRSKGVVGVAVPLLCGSRGRRLDREQKGMGVGWKEKFGKKQKRRDRADDGYVCGSGMRVVVGGAVVVLFGGCEERGVNL